MRSRAQHACRLEEPHASQSHDIQPSMGISLSFDVSPGWEIFWLGEAAALYTSPHRYRWCQISSRPSLLDMSDSGLANRLPPSNLTLACRAHCDVASSRSLSPPEYSGPSFGLVVVGLVCGDRRPRVLGYYTDATSNRVYGWINALHASTSGLGATSHF